MRRQSEWIRVAALLLAPLLGASLASSEEEPAVIGTTGTKQSLRWDDPTYVKPSIGGPGVTMTGGTRGAATPTPGLLAPGDHMGLTTSAQPILYWRLSQTSARPAVFVIQERDAVQTLVNRQLPTPTEAGVHAIDLSEFGVSLQPDVDYEWSIRLLVDPEHRAGDPVAEGTIRRTNLSAAVLERLERAQPHSKVIVLAESGFWYDALDAVSRQIREHPGNPGPLHQRDSLLEQVGLKPIVAE
jgi:hypothetical protein